MTASPPTTIPPTLGLILAGGRAQRMGGGDKALLTLGGESVLGRVLARLAPQCAGLVLNANGNASRFAGFGLPVVPDGVPDFAGPLAGILAGLDWVADTGPDLEWVVSVPADCPFIPPDLVVRLHAARAAAGTPLACARSGGRRHPVAGLWPVALREGLRRAIADGMRRADAFGERHGIALADWPDRPVDPFFNINRPEDLAEAERIVAQEQLPEGPTEGKVLNLRGLKCPLPALLTRKELARLGSGDEIVVECTDPLAAIDIPHLLQQTGDVLITTDRQPDAVVFRIRKA